MHWSDYAKKYFVFNEGQKDPVTSTFKFVGAALFIACRSQGLMGGGGGGGGIPGISSPPPTPK